jgi:hypothetical protein
MESLSVSQCRKLIGQPQEAELSDEEVVRLRDMLYSLAAVISDAFIDLDNTGLSAFEPPGEDTGRFEKRTADIIRQITEEWTAQ